jgi:predicted nucleic acid-binding protein
MARVLLDTTVLIDVLRGRPGSIAQLRRLRDRGDLPCACAVNVEEIARDLRSGEEEPVLRLVAGLDLVPLGEREGWRAGTWRRELAARGQTLSQADCLVAAAALTIGGRLATGNPQDFPMPELDVEHWPAGE